MVITADNNHDSLKDILVELFKIDEVIKQGVELHNFSCFLTQYSTEIQKKTTLDSNLEKIISVIGDIKMIDNLVERSPDEIKQLQVQLPATCPTCNQSWIREE